MKISNSQPAVPSSNSRSEDPDAKKKSGDDDSPFSKLLAKKKGSENEEEGPVGKGDPLQQSDFDRVAAGLVQGPFVKPDSPPQVTQVESKQPVSASIPVELQQLVREISVVVNTSGAQEVHIELNSQTLKGLHIQIERKEGAIAIQFQSSSPQVTELLQRNVTALSQALADKGMNDATIQIGKPGESAEAGDYKNQSQFSGRGQGGRQRGGR